MATDTSHRVLMGKILRAIFMGSSVFLQVTMTAKKAWMGSKFGKIGPGSATLERLKKSPQTYNGRNAMSTLVLSFFIESYSFLQVT